MRMQCELLIFSALFINKASLIPKDIEMIFVGHFASQSETD
jgi:hypothetical protein